jgi:predicted N-acyltransferase
MSVVENILSRPVVRPSGGVWSTNCGRAYVADLAALKGTAPWERIFTTQRKDHRVLEVVEETIKQDFAYHYLVLEDRQGKVRGIQPFFLRTQDLLGGKGPRVQELLRRARTILPRLLTMRTLMVGSPVGEGCLGAAPEDTDWCAEALLPALTSCARHFQASLIVMKEFPAGFRPNLARFIRQGYARIPSMPYVVLDLPFRNFEEYMQTVLSHAYRKNLRRKFKKAAQAAPITMEVVTDITPYAEEVYPLYLQVYERSALRFEKLTVEYLCRIGQTRPAKTRFFIWRQSGRVVAFSVCSLHDGALWDEYLGMDYRVALDLHLYFTTLRDMIEWCCAHGVKRYYSTALKYDPKLHLQFALVPMDLYVRHTTAVFNSIFARVVPMLDPTRQDATLKKFRNASEL